jgi:hypothetical protein
MRRYAVLAMLAIFASLSLAQRAPSRLTIVVEDASGAPIPGASVQVQHWASSAELIQDGVAATDAEGRASFELDPTVTYHVFASAHAFAPAAASVGNFGESGHVFKLAVIEGGGVRVDDRAR